MPESDLELLKKAAEKASIIARKFWQASPKVWDKDDNAGPVTEADLAVDEMLKLQLLGKRADYGWLSEETEDTCERLDRENVFIIDPIDGTRSFIAGERTWSHSLAISRHGCVTAAVVYVPLLERMYTAEIGKGAKLNGGLIQSSTRKKLTGATVLAAKPNFAPDKWRCGLPAIERHFRPSLAYRLALVAEGRFDAMLNLRRTWEWDIAAGALLAQEAGARVTDQFGNGLIFNTQGKCLDGCIVAAAEIHTKLLKRLN